MLTKQFEFLFEYFVFKKLDNTLLNMTPYFFILNPIEYVFQTNLITYHKLVKNKYNNNNNKVYIVYLSHSEFLELERIIEIIIFRQNTDFDPSLGYNYFHNLNDFNFIYRRFNIKHFNY